MSFQNGEVGFVNLLFLLIPMLIIIAFYTGRSSNKYIARKQDDLFPWKFVKKIVRTCPKHATMIKVKEMAILDHKNCDYCKKEIL